MKEREVYRAAGARYPDDKSATWVDFLVLKKDLGQGRWLASWWIWDSEWVGKGPANGHGIFMDHADDRDIELTETEINEKYNHVPDFKLSNPVEVPWVLYESK